MINVPTKVGPLNWARCFIKTSNRAGVFGINETFSRAAKRTYMALAKARGFGYYGVKQGPNPIFWNKKYWRFVEAKHVKIHGKGPNYRAWPGFNDDRYMTILVLQRVGEKGNPVGPPQAFLFTHWAAFGGNHKVPTKWVNARQAESIEFARGIIELGLDKGMIVWFSGDTNHGGAIDFGKNFHWVKPLGIDKIGVALPKGVKLEHKSVSLFDAPTDHNHGIASTVRFSYETNLTGK